MVELLNVLVNVMKGHWRGSDLTKAIKYYKLAVEEGKVKSKF